MIGTDRRQANYEPCREVATPSHEQIENIVLKKMLGVANTKIA